MARIYLKSGGLSSTLDVVTDDKIVMLNNGAVGKAKQLHIKKFPVCTFCLE